MNLRDLRQWQWLVIGAVGGLAIGAVRVACGPGYLQSTARTLSQPLFERGITASPLAAFRVSNLVIHPPDETGVYWVTGDYRETAGGKVALNPFKFRAVTPYHPQLAVDVPDPATFTIAAYLDQIAARVPQAQLSYRYAWYEQPLPAMMAWLLGVTLLIGGDPDKGTRILDGHRRQLQLVGDPGHAGEIQQDVNLGWLESRLSPIRQECALDRRRPKNGLTWRQCRDTHLRLISRLRLPRRGKGDFAMRLRIGLSVLGAALAFPLAANATVVNFQDSNNGVGTFVGQGAFADPGNNTWNGIPGSPGGTTSGNVTSSGGATPVTLTISDGFDNGAVTAADQGTPRFLLGNEAGVNNGVFGTFSLNNVPAGTYQLYLYGSNFDHNRGTTFTLSSGIPDTTSLGSTLNTTIDSYVLGGNYVVFSGVTPNASGTISGIFIPNPADGVGNANLGGEGSFNGLQLVSPATPEPASLGLLTLGGLGLLARRRRAF